jgi:hypothetical protein
MPKLCFATSCRYGANLRARAGSVGAVSAVDVEDMARDEPGFVRCDEHDAVGDFLGEAESAQRHLRRQGRLVLRCTGEAVSMPVSVGPGATAFTRMPDLASSSAADLVMPSMACLAPT